MYRVIDEVLLEYLGNVVDFWEAGLSPIFCVKDFPVGNERRVSSEIKFVIC